MNFLTHCFSLMQIDIKRKDIKQVFLVPRCSNLPAHSFLVMEVLKSQILSDTQAITTHYWRNQQNKSVIGNRSPDARFILSTNMQWNDSKMHIAQLKQERNSSLCTFCIVQPSVDQCINYAGNPHKKIFVNWCPLKPSGRMTCHNLMKDFILPARYNLERVKNLSVEGRKIHISGEEGAGQVNSHTCFPTWKAPCPHRGWPASPREKETAHQNTVQERHYTKSVLEHTDFVSKTSWKDWKTSLWLNGRSQDRTVDILLVRQALYRWANRPSSSYSNRLSNKFWN